MPDQQAKRITLIDEFEKNMRSSPSMSDTEQAIVLIRLLNEKFHAATTFKIREESNGSNVKTK